MRNARTLEGVHTHTSNLVKIKRGEKTFINDG